MGYKDKDKQREADRARQQRRRDVIKSKGVTNTRRDGQGVTELVTPTQTNRITPSGTKQGYIGAVPCAPPILEPNLKRGKDIKCFADLPPGVQQTIDMMSMVDGKTDHADRTKRIHAAKKYQHLFPDRYHSTSAVSTGIVIGKPGDADYNGVCTEAWRAERGR